jgi:hypothetical protein
MDLWLAGNLMELFNESLVIQNKLKSLEKPKTIAEISKKFATEMQKGNVNGAMKILTNNMQNGILPLNEKTISCLRQKHPEPKIADPEIILNDNPESVHAIIFEVITPESIRKAAIHTKGGSGPSGMDADGWRRLFTSNSFGNSSTELCEAFSKVIKKLCTVEFETNTLEPLLACRLIPLDKNPGLRPIGVGEILRRIAGKVVIFLVRDDVISSVGSLQVCAGHNAGSEALVHAMESIFHEENTEVVLLVDATNAFNSVNRNVFLHNIKIICPSISTFVQNCYAKPSRLFVIGGVEIKSSEGTTQGDPIAMAVYAIAIIPLILMIVEIMKERQNNTSKMAAYADDLAAAGNIDDIKFFWKQLCRLGPKFGYYPEASKTWLIVKDKHLEKAKKSSKTVIFK